MRQFVVATISSAPLLIHSSYALSIEVLSAEDLSSHCSGLSQKSKSPHGEFCTRYIQGFIDGAVATDARVMLNIEADYKHKQTFSERALRTRLPSRSEYLRAARYAEFCLGDPVPLREVVENIVKDLKEIDTPSSDISAREMVYLSLKKHYPCKPE
ncbi:Rap1a/Tai family immunity protein [Microbulbifer sp. TYP-18]|uniref:Rap1a/Tai family immunity protein n=1 Tax=Microbulbifer sp. TYP-18 TaxID=3230024 RepID=UPI0034C6CBEB